MGHKLAQLPESEMAKRTSVNSYLCWHEEAFPWEETLCSLCKKCDVMYLDMSQGGGIAEIRSQKGEYGKMDVCDRRLGTESTAKALHWWGPT